MRIAVVSDIHSNLPALEAVIAAVGSVDAWWHLGDVVGYGPHPDEVVGRLRELGAVGVRGNHDRAAEDGSDVDWFNPDARRAIEWTERRIAPETRRWLADLRERLVLENVTLVHGSPRDPTWEYITTSRVAAAGFAAMGTSWGLHGHTHIPAAWREEGREVGLARPADGDDAVLDERRVLLNPGSVGQPRDGNPLASYLLLDTEAQRATWHRVAYPIGATQADIRAAGLPEWLGTRLAMGQ